MNTATSRRSIARYLVLNFDLLSIYRLYGRHHQYGHPVTVKPQKFDGTVTGPGIPKPYCPMSIRLYTVYSTVCSPKMNTATSRRSIARYLVLAPLNVQRQLFLHLPTLNLIMVSVMAVTFVLTIHKAHPLCPTQPQPRLSKFQIQKYVDKFYMHSNF